jgi:S-adenosylmethionine:tRNA ribosyltransferase-isomerase
MSPEQAAFDYELPRDLIAQEPLRNRADARLMVVDRSRQSIDHLHVRDLPEILRAGDRLVVNNTRVVPARVVGVRTATGGAWQGLFLHTTDEGHWRILQKTRGRIQPGESVTLLDRNSRPRWKLWLLERLEEGEWLAHPDVEGDAFVLLDQVGRVPLPPYIRGGNMVDSDVESYQTIYSKRPGAAAAPTAGLHFTRAVLERLAARGVAFTSVTLHVGLDTFRPISTDSLEEHQMHSEWCEFTEKAAEEINATRSARGRVVAVGTTSVRVLETAAKTTTTSSSSSRDSSPPPSGWGRGSGSGGEAADKRQETGDSRQEPPSSAVRPFTGQTNLFIRPPYEFRAADALMTNFHFPRTTLLVLVATFGGRELMQRAYEDAVRQRYRFYSYGDAMLIL